MMEKSEKVSALCAAIVSLSAEEKKQLSAALREKSQAVKAEKMSDEELVIRICIG